MWRVMVAMLVLMLFGAGASQKLTLNLFNDALCATSQGTLVQDVGACNTLGLTGNKQSVSAFLKLLLVNETTSNNGMLPNGSQVLYSNYEVASNADSPCNGTTPYNCTLVVGACSKCFGVWLTVSAGSHLMSLLVFVGLTFLL
jgi:hypothetical protein